MTHAELVVSQNDYLYKKYVWLLFYLNFPFFFPDDKSLEKIDDDSKSEPESLEEGEVR